MKYEITDGGKIGAGFIHEKNDCVVRAYAIARNVPYYKSHALFQEAGRQPQKPLYFSRQILAATGLHLTFHRQTLTRFLQENPKGNFICVKRGHAFAVKNGVVFDDRIIHGNTNVLYSAQVVDGQTL